MSLTTNENILFQVAFKEACEFARSSGENRTADQLLKASLSLYKNVLVAGLDQLVNEKNQVENSKTFLSLKELQDILAKQKDIIAFRNTYREHLIALKEEEKDIIKQQINNK